MIRTCPAVSLQICTVLKNMPRHHQQYSPQSGITRQVIQHNSPRYPERSTSHPAQLSPLSGTFRQPSSTTLPVIRNDPPIQQLSPLSGTFHQPSSTTLPVIRNDPPRNPELISEFITFPPVVRSRFCPYICNWRAGILASENATQHNGMPSPTSKSTPGRA